MVGLVKPLWNLVPEAVKDIKPLKAFVNNGETYFNRIKNESIS